MSRSVRALEKQIRIVEITLARTYVVQGKHELARALFAKHGISYCPSPIGN